MADKVRILGIAGSLRAASYNRAALKEALKVAPPDAAMDTFDIQDIPPFSEDLEQQPPPAVRELKAKVRQADAILFVTPEYNYSMPGVLKNAIDWASRPYGDNAWDGKPVAIMGASIGAQGTSRAQYHLRQTCVFLDMHPLNRPEVMIPAAAEKFDAQGNLTDAKTKAKIKELIEALVAWTRRLQGR